MVSPDNPSLSAPELAYYARHLALPGFGLAAQQRLKAARVLVVGAGGLGSPLLQYLAAAGVGTIGLVDPDRVSVSNLHRQVLYGMEDIGRLKVEAACTRLQALNPHLDLIPYPEALTRDNALDLVAGYDVVADGSDNFPTRYLVNDACVLLNKVNVYASVFRFEGQVSVFHYPDSEGNRGPNYRDLYPLPPTPGQVPSCAEGGILGVLPGIIGTIQALEVIKVLTGVGEPLAGRLLLLDAATMQSRLLRVPTDPANPLTGLQPTQTGLVDYEQFCGLRGLETAEIAEGRSLSPQELQAWMAAGRDLQLIDLREPYERAIVHIGGLHIPAVEIMSRQAEIARDRPVILHCRSGQRSAKVQQRLESEAGFANLYNLRGGILAWAQEIDPSLPVY